MIRYLSVEQVLSLHQNLVDPLSGDPGIRDLRALDAAVARPSLVFEGEDLYPTLAAKAAALAQALVTADPFATATAATAIAAAECFLVANGATLHADHDDLLRLVTGIRTGDTSLEAFAIALSQRTVNARRQQGFASS